MLAIKRALLCLWQMHRQFDLAVYTRHSEHQESLLELFEIPRVNFKRRRVIARLWGNTYLATYYVTNTQRYARMLHGEAELGSSLHRQTINVLFTDLYPTESKLQPYDVLQVLHYDLDGIIDHIAEHAGVDCTLLKFKRLSAKYTEANCTIFADDQPAIVINF